MKLSAGARSNRMGHFSASLIKILVSDISENSLRLQNQRHSLIKLALRASALRADGVSHTKGLVLAQPISPTPCTRPQSPLGASPPLTIR